MKNLWLAISVFVAATAALPQQTFAQVRPPYRDGDLGRWCNDVIGRLEDARERAQSYWNQPSEQASLLVSGLQDAYQSAGPGTGLLTSTALYRGMELSNRIRSALQGCQGADRTLVYFLQSYYDFTIGLARDVDLPYYVPQRERCGRCNMEDQRAFEEAFVRYTREQLQLVLDTLTDNQNGWITPVGPQGSAVAFLTALELSAGYAAGDLRSSIFAARYSCQIQRLESLTNRIYMYNQGGGGDDVRAVGEFYREASDILGDLTPDRCDWRRWDRDHDRYGDHDRDR